VLEKSNVLGVIERVEFTKFICIFPSLDLATDKMDQIIFDATMLLTVGDNSVKKSPVSGTAFGQHRLRRRKNRLRGCLLLQSDSMY
jgi:hypothetical protein